MTDPTRLDPDNVRIGENLRSLMDSANERKTHGDRLTWRVVAKAVPVGTVTLSRVLAGQRGLSESKLLLVAEALGVHPARALAGVSEKCRAERYPHVPSETTRNKADIARKGHAVSSIESVIRNPRTLSHFLGGVHPQDIEIFQALLTHVLDRAKAKREEHRQAGRYDPETGRFS